MIKNFNYKKDVLVIPKNLDVSKLNWEVRKMVESWEKLGRVIRMNYIYTPAVVGSY
jgi:hypothetical protein